MRGRGLFQLSPVPQVCVCACVCMHAWGCLPMYISVCFLAAQDAPDVFSVPALENPGFVLFFKFSIHNGYEYFVEQMYHKFSSGSSFTLISSF